MLNIALVGYKGRVGSRFFDFAADISDFNISLLVDKDNINSIVLSEVDLVIDFSLPDGTKKILERCLLYSKPLVCGVTGISNELRSQISVASKKIPIFYAENFSIGVNILFSILESATAMFNKINNEEVMSDSFSDKVKILDEHHANKLDAPSGTAKKISELIKNNLSECKVEFDSIRQEDIVGSHTVTFSNHTDTLAFVHKASTKDAFIEGAVIAAKWLLNKKAGLYNMLDVLSIK